MDITLDISLAASYISPSQKARVLTEDWVQRQAFCPNCGKVRLEQYERNRKVADFVCAECREEYELKGKKSLFANRVSDGAYGVKMQRLSCSTNPNLFLMNYDVADGVVKNFTVVPKHFFTPEIIEKRKALAPTAKRAGWVGSNILLKDVPESGRICIVRNGIIVPRAEVLTTWRRTLFLRDETDLKSRGWLLDVMAAVEKLGSKEFTLSQIYEFEDALGRKHPDNRHVKDKIRQQLQVLRDKGYLEFVERGRYRLV